MSEEAARAVARSWLELRFGAVEDVGGLGLGFDRDLAVLDRDAAGSAAALLGEPVQQEAACLGPVRGQLPGGGATGRVPVVDLPWVGLLREVPRDEEGVAVAEEPAVPGDAGDTGGGADVYAVGEVEFLVGPPRDLEVLEELGRQVRDERRLQPRLEVLLLLPAQVVGVVGTVQQRMALPGITLGVADEADDPGADSWLVWPA